MEETDKQAGMFLELRQRLQSGLLVLRSDVAGDPPEVTVSGSACGVNQHTEAPGSVMRKLQVKKSYSFSCQRCRESVLTERVFRRVLPLPNGNWNLLVENWCCHADPFANRKLLPRPGDCFLGDTYFLLPMDSECDRTLRQEPSPAHTDTGHNQDSGQKPSRMISVLCRACGAVLGETIAAGTLKLYITELMVKRSDEDGEEAIGKKPRCLFLEQTVAARLSELSSTQSIFRFSLQTPNGKAFILLWLLNTDSLVASLSLPAVSGDASISPGDDVSVHTQHLSCGASSAVKVLYLPCAPSLHQEITDAWEKDVGVHPLILPQSTCQEVMQLLASSTSRLPPSLRRMNSYQVAFMRL
ncbi:hypothetical protein SKAU_G00216360 [Synaphobranchus kaupii]|uniref:E3 ubiquitin-protein ligase E3D n=1 Tax=Synaphobranchus kaupii TaxID=118154 RepID=A0A9Q1F9T4_SYNKA|nr:hypothetical protein SKAU_G00216360 [Synaphobranchus kaupii]